jgi:uncharacterized protein YciI
VKPTVVISGGGNEIIRTETGRVLSEVLQGVNKAAEGHGDLDNLRQYFTENAFGPFKQLVKNTGLVAPFPEYRTRVLQTATGQYEVRGIRVRVKMGQTPGDDSQELVFVLNFRLFIDNVQFAMESQHYTRLLEEGKKLDDMVYRQQILSFLEDFRTAHNRKDIDYLERAYSDDALIIVGRVLEKQEGSGDLLQSSSLSQKKIEFIKLSKKQYIDRLRKAFAANSFVRVTFEDVEIIRDSRYPDIYGIKLRQRWNSSTYSDEGYLFVMMDFHDPKQPLIHVRSWQPEPFSDGSVVGLGDFEIIE